MIADLAIEGPTIRWILEQIKLGYTSSFKYRILLRLKA